MIHKTYHFETNIVRFHYDFMGYCFDYVYIIICGTKLEIILYANSHTLHSKF